MITVETDKTENVAVTTEESTVDTTEATVTQVPDSGEKFPYRTHRRTRPKIPAADRNTTTVDSMAICYYRI